MMPMPFVHRSCSRLIALLTGIFFSITAAAQVPVILRVTAAEQSDTNGCNFVRELSRISYNAVMSGKARLWNSSAKDFQVYPQSLASIEKSTGVSFKDQEVVFLYEYWTNTGDELKSTTTGFLFSGKSARGEDVEFGYIEYQDLQSVFIQERVLSNVNGNHNTSLENLLLSKKFNFQFLQFAGRVINNVNDSRKIRDEYIGAKRFNPGAFTQNEVPQKSVIWTLDYSVDQAMKKSAEGNKLLLAVQDYLKENEEVFFNLGGDKVPAAHTKAKWKVTRIEVEELWKKINNEVLFDPLTLTIYVNDSALSTIPYRDLLKMEIKIEEIQFMDFLRLKSFNFVIRKINQEDILRSESYLYSKALLESDWNKVSWWVNNAK